MKLRNLIPPEHRLTAAACVAALAVGGGAMGAGIALGEHHVLRPLPRPCPAAGTRYVTQAAEAPYAVPGPAVTRTAYVRVPGPAVTRTVPGPAVTVTVTHSVPVPGPTVTVTVTQTVTAPASASSSAGGSPAATAS